MIDSHSCLMESLRLARLCDCVVDIRYQGWAHVSDHRGQAERQSFEARPAENPDAGEGFLVFHIDADTPRERESQLIAGLLANARELIAAAREAAFQTERPFPRLQELPEAICDSGYWL